MGLETQEYHPIPNKINYNEKLFNIDKKIGYITTDYENKKIQELKNKLNIISQKFPNKDLLLLYKWKIILEEIQKYPKNLPINQHIVLNYFIIHLLTLEEIKKIKITSLFQLSTENDWIFAKIYSLILDNNNITYLHFRHQNNFNLKQINKDEEELLLKKMNIA